MTHPSTLLIQKLIADTLASIAYTLGDVQVDNTGQLKLTPLADPLARQGGAAAAYFLLWCLWRVVVCPVAGAGQVEMARGALRIVGSRFGLGTAGALAEMGRD